MEPQELQQIQQEVGELFGWNKPNILVRLTALAIARLQTCYNKNTPQQPNRAAGLWQDARQAAFLTSLETLRKLLGYDFETNKQMDKESAKLYDRFLAVVREELEKPAPDIPERAPSLAEQLKLEQALWRQVKEAMQVCAFAQKASLYAQKMAPKANGSGSGHLPSVEQAYAADPPVGEPPVQQSKSVVPGGKGMIYRIPTTSDFDPRALDAMLSSPALPFGDFLKRMLPTGAIARHVQDEQGKRPKQSSPQA